MMFVDILDKLHLRWSRRVEGAQERVDKAFSDVTKTNLEVRKAAYDHADSDSYVTTTVGALLGKMERRELNADDAKDK